MSRLAKTNGIVLHQIKYGDSSIIVRVYTEEFGVQSYLIRGVKSKKSNIKSGLFQVGNILDMVVYRNENRSVQHVKEVQIAFPSNSISFDVKKKAIVIFMIEIFYRSIIEEEPNKPLFDFIVNSIRELDSKEEKYANLHLVFSIHLTQYLGFLPRKNFSETKKIFDLKEGVFVSHQPHHDHYLTPLLSTRFFKFLTTDYDEMHKISMTGRSRMELLEKLLEYYRLHLPLFGEIKSHHVLSVVLA
jgi:DNA repair protein RecO (recombination protein O)